MGISFRGVELIREDKVAERFDKAQAPGAWLIMAMSTVLRNALQCLRSFLISMPDRPAFHCACAAN